jgi:class 3 adenylate cyclase
VQVHATKLWLNAEGGRFVNSAGDSVLAELASVVNAVQCAVEIQSLCPAWRNRNREKSIVRCANPPGERADRLQAELQNAVSFTQRRFGKRFRRASRRGDITVASWQTKSSGGFWE